MTITIYPTTNKHHPKAKEQQCSCVDPMYDEYGKADPDCPYCDGTGVEIVRDSPEVNMSNDNALTILRMVLGPTASYYGEIKNSEIPKYLRKIMFLLNTNKDIEKNVRADDFSSDKRMMSFGIDAEYIKDRLQTFRDILVYAQKHDEDVVWG